MSDRYVKKTLEKQGFSSDSGTGRYKTRTCNLRLVRAALWPIELIARGPDHTVSNAYCLWVSAMGRS